MSKALGSEGGVPGASDRTRWATIALVVALGSLVVGVYVLVISAGTGTTWPRWSSFIDTQAEGFRAGHLYALVPGAPDERHWDYAHHDGHSYLYWGALPPALLAGAKTLLRVHAEVGDELLVFLVVILRAVAGAVLLGRLARHLVPRPGGASLYLSAVVFALANPTPFMLARAAVYEVAIGAGSAFIALGLTCAVEGLFAPTRARARRWLGGASLAFGLAASSRSSLWPAAALLVAFLALAYVHLHPPYPGGGRLRWLARLGLSLGTPVGALLAGCLLYNHARFGAWSEFGLKYQVGFVFSTGARFWPANVFLYLFEPLTTSCHFPYLTAPWNGAKGLLPSWLPVAPDYRPDEPTAGIFVALPFLWPLILLAWTSGRVAIDRLRGRVAPANADARGRWLRGLLVVGAVASAVPLLFVFSISMRYETDFLTFVLPLASLAAWDALAAPRRRPVRVAVQAAFVVAALATLVVGVLLGFTGYFNTFDRHNPALIEHLRGALDLCGRLQVPLVGGRPPVLVLAA